MLRGIGIATSQLLAQGQRLKALAANLSNVDTPGYRQDRIAEQTFEGLLLSRFGTGGTGGPSAGPVGPIDLGPVVSRPEIDLSQGPVEQTGRPLDVAIDGDGFFVVQAPDGPRYTRRGAFHQDGKGQIDSLEGWPVLGKNGPIVATGQVTIDPAGAVVSNGKVVDHLQIVGFPAGAALDRREGTYVVPKDAAPTPIAHPNLLAGSLEGSNVDLTSTMTDVLAATRSYQMAQRALTTEDSALNQLIQQVNSR